MIKLAANLSMLFVEHDFLERFAAAAKAGFRGVEYLFPYAHEPRELRGALDDNGLQQVLFNLPPGDWDAGERGLASLPGREAEFRDSVSEALRYAEALDCPRLHAMAGLLPAEADEATREAHLSTYIDNLRHAAAELARIGRTLLIEPINTHDMPGYFLDRQAQAREVLGRVGADNLRVQFDVYHCQMSEGNLFANLEAQLPYLGHVQIAGVPDRGEPDAGEVDFRHLLAHLAGLGWTAPVGAEYRPRGGRTEDGLGWLQAFRGL